MSITVCCAKCGVSFLMPRNQPRTNKFGKHYCGRGCWYTRNGASVAPSAELQDCRCVKCGKNFSRRKGLLLVSKRTFCRSACYHSYNRHKNHVNWNGGRFVDGDGYVHVRLSDGGYREEHIAIAERVLGRKLQKGEVVHHINGNKADNRNCNLLICNCAYHAWLHSEMSRLYQMEHFGEKEPMNARR